MQVELAGQRCRLRGEAGKREPAARLALRVRALERVAAEHGRSATFSSTERCAKGRGIW